MAQGLGKGGGAPSTAVQCGSAVIAIDPWPKGPRFEPLEAKGRHSLIGTLEVSSMRACLTASKAAIAWASPRVPRGKA